MDSVMSIPKLKKEVRITEFDSMQQKPTYLVILNDRQWQISEEIKQIVDLIDGYRDIGQIAQCLSDKFEKQVPVDVIRKIVSEILTSRGILENSELPAKDETTNSKFLWFKRVILKTKSVEKFHFLTVLFNKYLFLILGIFSASALIMLLSAFLQPEFVKNVMHNNLLQFMEFFLWSSLFVFVHELGHMAACMKCGIEPGEIGFGIYLTMPILYSDVSRTWQLKRKERLMVDLGGIYFEGIALAITATIAYITGNAKLLNVICLNVFSIIFALNPFIKMDGYWVFTDLTGIANLHRTMGRFIKSKWYAIFGVKVDCGIDLYEVKIKRFFYLYTLLTSMYIVFISVSMIHFIVTFFGDIPGVFKLFNIAMTQKNGFLMLKSFVKIIYDNIFLIFSGVAVINIIYLALKGVYKTAVTFIGDMKKHRKMNE